MIKLRDYQEAVVNDVRLAYRDGFKAPLVVLPTGGGKTTIFAYVTTGASQKGRCIFLIAHRAELVKQIAITLARFGTKHQIIAPGPIVRQTKVEQFKAFGRSLVDNSSRVYVCSVQTLVRRMDTITDVPDIIVIDEAHHLTETSQWGQVCAAYPDAKLLPVTATPCRLDRKGLGKDFGGFADTIVIGPTMRWLIDNGYLSEYRLLAPPNALDLTGVRTRMGDFAKEQLEAAVDRPSITGNAVEHYLRLATGKRAVAFCVSVQHAEHVAQEFAAAGVPSEFLDGSLDPAERDRRIKAFEAGEILVLTSCDVVSEGFDLPAIEVAILLRPTKSLSLYLQQVGRALRVFPGKTEAIILDHVAAIRSHGLPDEDREWSLEGKADRKRGAANDNEPALTIVTCKQCFTVHRPGPSCPWCGYLYPDKPAGRQLDHQDGDLVEIDAHAKAKMRAMAEQQKLEIRKQRKRQERDCKTLEELVELGRSRGYQYPQAWAERMWGFRKQPRQASE